MVFVDLIVDLLDEIIDNPLLEVIEIHKKNLIKKDKVIVYSIVFEDVNSSLKISVLINIYPDFNDGDINVQIFDINYDALIFNLEAYIDLSKEEVLKRIQSLTALVDDLLKGIDK